MSLASLDLTGSKRVKLVHPLRYTSVNDVKMRLHGSVVRYRGVPVHVINLSDELKVRVSCPTDHTYDGIDIHSSDVDLDITSVHVGWINHPKIGPVYLMRAPWRQQKQGLNLRTMAAFVPGQGETEAMNVMSPGSSVNLICYALAGMYKTFQECLDSVNGGAFSTEWAIAKPVKDAPVYVVYHKSVPVGVFVRKTKTFMFTRGTLSKTRRASLVSLIPSIGGYVVTEQS